VRRRRSAAIGLSLLLAACHAARGLSGDGRAPPHEGLHAVLWSLTSAERYAAAEQSYRLARARLDEALAPENAGWTAVPDQEGACAGLPPAVLLDVDEAVLDSASFQAGIVAAGGRFTLAEWNAWVRQARAPAIPGALEFTGHARARGVRIFYVTNREYAVEEATRRNLEALGFPVDADGANLLSRNERSGWGRDKRSRRRFAAAEHRVLLIVGDDLNDFVSGSRADPQSRRALAQQWRSYWGTRWIVLPNPMYGGWERALYGFDEGLSRDERLRRKRDELRRRD
jgi:5'-nucleotidase (lipoprotein e(P4) family)